MPALENYLTIKEAAAELGLTSWGVRTAIQEGRLEAVPLAETSRTKLITRAEVERYKREHKGRRGKRPQPDDLTEQQRKQRAYQQAYYQRRKAARQQPATEPEE
jgi:excisionase family DNA binding protein